MFSKDLTNFYKANIICFFTAITLLGLSFMIGKVEFFLMLNNDLGKLGDFVFDYTTYFGDGYALIPFALFVIIFKRRYLLLVILSILISVLIAHYIKGHVILDNPRPWDAISNHSLIHVIPNIEIHYSGSFPSGHTTQAFCIFLLLCIILNSKKIISIGFLIALAVGYSRVYQAQHFPRDIGGGILVAMFSCWVSLILNEIISNSIKKLVKTKKATH